MQVLQPGDHARVPVAARLIGREVVVTVTETKPMATPAGRALHWVREDATGECWWAADYDLEKVPS